jgi:hypothetical protein
MSPKNLTTVLLAGSVLGIGGYFLGANLIVARKNARIEQIRRTYVAAPENETAKQVYEAARKHQNELKSYRTVTLRPGKTNDLQVRVEKLHLKQDGKYFSKSSTRTLAGSRQVGVTITSLRNADGTWVLVGDEVAILDNTPRRMPVAVSTIQRTRSAPFSGKFLSMREEKWGGRDVLVVQMYWEPLVENLTEEELATIEGEYIQMGLDQGGDFESVAKGAEQYVQLLRLPTLQEHFIDKMNNVILGDSRTTLTGTLLYKNLFAEFDPRAPIDAKDFLIPAELKRSVAETRLDIAMTIDRVRHKQSRP